jgi:hypothetical protein
MNWRKLRRSGIAHLPSSWSAQVSGVGEIAGSIQSRRAIFDKLMVFEKQCGDEVLKPRRND